MARDPSRRSGFRLRAPASLTPASRLNFTSCDLVGDVLREYVYAAHGSQRPSGGQWPVSQIGVEKDKVPRSWEGHGFVAVNPNNILGVVTRVFCRVGKPSFP